MSKREVVVTGLGVLSPIGIELDSFWNSLVEGKSGVSYLSSCQTELEQRPIGSEVPSGRAAPSTSKWTCSPATPSACSPQAPPKKKRKAAFPWNG
ncbi:MAG: hypothetical protein II655_06155, partial [Thermoguttaceae bacterium]|nr:hypothetical protein [Thermoguttaceae bacterium]